MHLKTLTFETINTELTTLPDMEATLRGSALVYIPGGNTFLLNHHLHLSKFMDTLQRKVRAGFPLVAFSAGIILCGPNILTSTDMNLVGTSYFTGLKVTSFNFYVHEAWILRKGKEKEKLSAGEPIRRCMTQQGQHAFTIIHFIILIFQASI